MHPLSKTRVFAQAVAYQLVQLFPHCQVFDADSDGFGFYVDFVCPQSLKLDLVVDVLTPRMMEVPKPLGCEMLASNLKEVLEDVGQNLLARRIKSSSRHTVEILRWDNLFFPCKVPESVEIANFWRFLFLNEWERPFEGVNLSLRRLYGVLAEGGRELKDLCKRFKGWSLPDVPVVCDRGFPVWTDLTLFRKLFGVWRDFLVQWGIKEVLAVDPIALEKCNLKACGQFAVPGKEEFVDYPWGAWNFPLFLEDKIFMELDSPQWSSFLQSLEKTIKVFPINTQWVEVPGSGVFAELSDGLGRRWPGPYVKWTDESQKKVLVSLFGPLERFVAAAMEGEEKIKHRNTI